MPARARAKRLPGQPGTRGLLRQYGDRLVCVRYRYDREARKRYKTVEIIVDEAPWEPPSPKPDPQRIIYIRVIISEPEIIRQVKAAGGKWRRDYKLWALPYATAERLGLLDRIVDPFA